MSMEKLSPLTVNIFQETIGSKIPLDMIESGVDAFREVTEGVQIKCVGERKHIQYAGANYVTADRYVPESLGADLGILVTRRALVYSTSIDEEEQEIFSNNENGLDVVGVAINGKSLSLPKIALISVGDDPFDFSVASTTTHELGHLVNVKSYGETYDQVDHCNASGCVMNSVVNDDEKVKYKFCEECTPQIVEHTTLLRRVKAGRSLTSKQRLKLVGQSSL